MVPAGTKSSMSREGRRHARRQRLVARRTGQGVGARSGDDRLRWRRAVSVASRGSPRSQPSLTTTTTALLRITRRAQWRLERPERFTDPGSTRPVADRQPETRVKARFRSRSRSSRVTPGQARPDDEGLRPDGRSGERLAEAQEHPGVALHRARDVADHDELAWPADGPAPDPVQDVATGRQAAPEHDPGRHRPAVVVGFAAAGSGGVPGWAGGGRSGAPHRAAPPRSSGRIAGGGPPGPGRRPARTRPARPTAPSSSTSSPSSTERARPPEWTRRISWVSASSPTPASSSSASASSRGGWAGNGPSWLGRRLRAPARTGRRRRCRSRSRRGAGRRGPAPAAKGPARGRPARSRPRGPAEVDRGDQVGGQPGEAELPAKPDRPAEEAPPIDGTSPGPGRGPTGAGPTRRAPGSSPGRIAVTRRLAAARRRGRAPRESGEPPRPDAADILLVLEDHAQGVVDNRGGQVGRTRGRAGPTPSRGVSATPGTLSGRPRASDGTKPTTWRASRSGAAGTPG